MTEYIKIDSRDLALMNYLADNHGTAWYVIGHTFRLYGKDGLIILRNNGLIGEEIASMYRLCNNNIELMISKLRT